MIQMNPLTIKVEEFNEVIPPYLDQFSHGYVHSVFNNGFNIKMGQRVFFIGREKNGRLPFGIHLSITDVRTVIEWINEETKVTWDPDQQALLFPVPQVTILLQEGRSFMSKLEFMPESEHTVVTHLETSVSVLGGNGEPTGLGLDIESFMLAYLTGEQTNHGEMTRRTLDLIEAASSEDRSFIEKTLRYFLGRGSGLTPSGDDHTVGLLAVHTITDGLSQVFVDEVRKLVKNETITTHVGQEYLFYALKGEFSSAVTDIGHDLTKIEPEKLDTHILNLLPMGHSSGVDTAFGMLMGLLVLRRKINGR